MEQLLWIGVGFIVSAILVSIICTLATKKDGSVYPPYKLIPDASGTYTLRALFFVGDRPLYRFVAGKVTPEQCKELIANLERPKIHLTKDATSKSYEERNGYAKLIKINND